MPIKDLIIRFQPVQLYIVLTLSVVFFLVQLYFSHTTHSSTLLVHAYHMCCNILALSGCILTIKVSWFIISFFFKYILFFYTKKPWTSFNFFNAWIPHTKNQCGIFCIKQKCTKIIFLYVFNKSSGLCTNFKFIIRQTQCLICISKFAYSR